MKQRQFVYQYMAITVDGQVEQGILAAESRQEAILIATDSLGDLKYLKVHALMDLVPIMAYGRFTGEVDLPGAGGAYAR